MNPPNPPNLTTMHVGIKEFADADSFDALKFATTDEDRDAAIAEGWTLCQTETAITEGLGKLFKGLDDGVLTLHVLGRNE